VCRQDTDVITTECAGSSSGGSAANCNFTKTAVWCVIMVHIRIIVRVEFHTHLHIVSFYFFLFCTLHCTCLFSYDRNFSFLVACDCCLICFILSTWLINPPGADVLRGGGKCRRLAPGVHRKQPRPQQDHRRRRRYIKQHAEGRAGGVVVYICRRRPGEWSPGNAGERDEHVTART